MSESVCESCKELWTVQSRALIGVDLQGVDVIDDSNGEGNGEGNGSHDEPWKLVRIPPVSTGWSVLSTSTVWTYLSFSQHGRDGNGLYWERFCCMICVDGKVQAQASQYWMCETLLLLVPRSSVTTVARSYCGVSTNAVVVVVQQPSNNTGINQNSNYVSCLLRLLLTGI